MSNINISNRGIFSVKFSFRRRLCLTRCPRFNHTHWTTLSMASNMATKKDLFHLVDSDAHWSLFSLLGVVWMKVRKVRGHCHQVQFCKTLYKRICLNLNPKVIKSAYYLSTPHMTSNMPLVRGLEDSSQGSGSVNHHQSPTCTSRSLLQDDHCPGFATWVMRFMTWQEHGRAPISFFLASC